MSNSPENEHISSGPAFEKLGLLHRVRVPQGAGPRPVLVMSHGFKGNEDVTWVFARAAGPEWLIVSPRAPFPCEDGYSWTEHCDDNKNALSSYHAGLAALTRFIAGLTEVYGA